MLGSWLGQSATWPRAKLTWVPVPASWELDKDLAQVGSLLSSKVIAAEGRAIPCCIVAGGAVVAWAMDNLGLGRPPRLDGADVDVFACAPQGFLWLKDWVIETVQAGQWSHGTLKEGGILNLYGAPPATTAPVQIIFSRIASTADGSDVVLDFDMDYVRAAVRRRDGQLQLGLTPGTLRAWSTRTTFYDYVSQRRVAKAIAKGFSPVWVGVHSSKKADRAVYGYASGGPLVTVFGGTHGPVVWVMALSFAFLLGLQAAYLPAAYLPAACLPAAAAAVSSKTTIAQFAHVLRQDPRAGPTVASFAARLLTNGVQWATHHAS